MAIDFSTVPNTSGAFPLVLAVNSTTPTTLDGTPLTAEWLKDFYGFHQAIMDHAGYVAASGSNETVGASEVLTSIQRVSGHPGEIVPWMGTGSIPTGLRILELTGQVILIANYADLVDAVYVGDANNATAAAFYKTSDAGGTTRSTSGTYMVLPSLQGYVLRGLDTAAAIDPDGAGRTVGDTQLDAFQKHNHAVYTATGSAAYADSSFATAGAVAGFSQVASTNNQLLARKATDDASAGNTIKTEDDETRMVNSATRFCIRF